MNPRSHFSLLALLCLAPCAWAQKNEPVEGSIGSAKAPEVLWEEGPSRPDLSELSPEAAKAALEKYQQNYDAWQERMKPLREAAYREALALAAARKEERERLETEREKRSAAGEKMSERPADSSAVTVSADYTWQQDARRQRLDAAAVTRLEQDGLVIAGEDFRQSFSVYGDASVIPFVTSDALLNGFHVLLEASLKKYELRRSGQLRAVLEAFWQNLDGRLAEKKVSRTLVAPCLRHLALVTGPALRLLGSTIPLGDANVESEIDATIAKIAAAKSMDLPSWLAPAEPGLLAIDFRRCRPLGFYAESPALANYYRAVRWLQLVPLRASRESETGAAALLAEITGRGPTSLPGFVEQGESIWGKEDGASVSRMEGGARDFLSNVAKVGNRVEATKAVSVWLQRFAQSHSEKVPDRLRMPHDAPADAYVRILAGTALPDALFLESIAEKRPAGKITPQGLEVAAWLGSEFAINQIGPVEWKRLTKPDRTPELEWPDSIEWATIPEGYYEVLKTLFLPPDPVAPAFMHSDAWRRKSLQTALAGWAQLRHAWELQTKLTVSTLGMSIRPSGFIEPNPDFFQRLGRLETVLVARLQEASVFSDVAADEVEFLRGELNKVDRIGLGMVAVSESDDVFEQPEYDRLFEVPWYAHQMDASIEYRDWDELHGQEQVKFWQRVTQALKERIARMERGEPVPALDSTTYRYDGDRQLFARWQGLQTLTGRLEVMVQKQLRGVDWNVEEAELLKNFREHLGEVMGYFSSATLMPKDDASRWTTVHFDPNTNRNLAVAIGRARALYVLYPWKGKKVLCRGAVMSYYEYPAENRLTDMEWKRLLDSPAAPAQPEWIRPVTVVAPKR